MSMKIISRGKGDSVVAAAAYRAAETIKNEYDGVLHDYSRKGGVVYSAIEVPDYAPVEYNYRHYLWNAVEQVEKAKNAQLAREVRLALPNEFDFWTNVSLVHEYVKKNFVDSGMCADIAIHDSGDGNIHAHILLSMRAMEQDGSWSAKSRMEYILDDNGERIKLPSGRYKTKKVTTTDWDNRDNAEIWREAWADILNQYLEKGGHDFRVDHRSFERQGLEQIPTIHLGSVAHGLEKQGIRTERGDINRRIRAANARLKEIDGKIHEIQNPPKPKLIIDLENSIKAQNSPGYSHWCKIFNLQQAARTLLYIQENGYTDLESLQTARQESLDGVAEIQQQIRRVQAQIKSLKSQKEQAENYRNTLDTYKKYIAPGQIKRFKDDYYSRHMADIEAHKIAKSYLFDELKLVKFPSLKKLSGDISDLYAKEKELRQTLSSSKRNANSLYTIVRNTQILLGYRELESSGYTPTIPTKDLRFSTPCEMQFTEAQSAGQAEEYFQSGYMDYECASDIMQAIENGRGYAKTAEDVLTKYCKERAERVVATIVQYAHDDKFPAHREWATKKKNPAQSEPTARNMEIYKQCSTSGKVTDLFVQKLREIAGSMKSAMFPFDDGKMYREDENGNPIFRSGWVLPSESTWSNPKPEQRDMGGVSLAERMAAAQQKVDDYDRNRATTSSKNPKRSNNHSL